MGFPVKKALRPWKPPGTGQILDQSAEIRRPCTCGEPMSVVVYIVLTVVIFALLGLVQKLVEGL